MSRLPTNLFSRSVAFELQNYEVKIGVERCVLRADLARAIFVAFVKAAKRYFERCNFLIGVYPFYVSSVRARRPTLEPHAQEGQSNAECRVQLACQSIK